MESECQNRRIDQAPQLWILGSRRRLWVASPHGTHIAHLCYTGNVAAVPPVIVISTYATGFTGIMFLLTVTRSIAHPYKNMTVLQRLSKDGAMYFLLMYVCRLLFYISCAYAAHSTAVNAIMIPPSWAKLIDIFPTALVNWVSRHYTAMLRHSS